MIINNNNNNNNNNNKDLLQGIPQREVLHLQYLCYVKCTKKENTIEYIHIYSYACYLKFFISKMLCF